MPSPTMTLIQSVTVPSGGSASIDFTSIPSTFTDLCVKLSFRNTTSGVENVSFEFNGVTTGYSGRNLYGSGSAAGSSNPAHDIGINQPSSFTANTFANMEVYVPNYAGSSNKSFSSDAVDENNATEAYQVMDAKLWSNTAAITSIKIAPHTGNWVQYSTAYLYGIKNS